MSRVGSIVASTVFAFCLPPAASSGQDARPPRPPENVKILTELAVPELRAEMQRIATALGVKCDHCHVQGNDASDERSAKRMARWMLEMTREINRKQFPKYEPAEGASVLGRVTCFTCHRGEMKPRVAPQ
jgi:photosynthetic reaction center cytochrome c subunit